MAARSADAQLPTAAGALALNVTKSPRGEGAGGVGGACWRDAAGVRDVRDATSGGCGQTPCLPGHDEGGGGRVMSANCKALSSVLGLCHRVTHAEGLGDQGPMASGLRECPKEACYLLNYVLKDI